MLNRKRVGGSCGATWSTSEPRFSHKLPNSWIKVTGWGSPLAGAYLLKLESNFYVRPCSGASRATPSSGGRPAEALPPAPAAGTGKATLTAAAVSTAGGERPTGH